MLYIPDPSANLLLVILASSGGDEPTTASFAVRREYLSAASDVFEGMLASSTDAQAEKDTTTGLPIVNLLLDEDEKVEDWDVMLRLIARDQVKPDVSAMGIDKIERLYHLSRKFSLPLIQTLALTHLSSLANSDPAPVLRIALLNEELTLARAALGRFRKPWVPEYHPGQRGGKHKGKQTPERKKKDKRVFDLGDPLWVGIPERLIGRVVQLDHRRKSGHGSWADLAKDFTLS